MCWWGVVPVERLHRQHWPLGTHPRMCMGDRTRHLWDRQMATLATLWKANIDVCFVHQQLFLRHSSNLFRRRSGGVPSIWSNTYWNNLVPTICLCFFSFFRQTSSLWTPNRWSTTPVITQLMFCGGDTPRGCVASLGFHRPHKMGPYRMRPTRIVMPVLGWAKTWSGRPSHIMSTGHLPC